MLSPLLRGLAANRKIIRFDASRGGGLLAQGASRRKQLKRAGYDVNRPIPSICEWSSGSLDHVEIKTADDVTPPISLDRNAFGSIVSKEGSYGAQDVVRIIASLPGPYALMLLSKTIGSHCVPKSLQTRSRKRLMKLVKCAELSFNGRRQSKPNTA